MYALARNRIAGHISCGAAKRTDALDVNVLEGQTEVHQREDVLEALEGESDLLAHHSGPHRRTLESEHGVEQSQM